MIGASNKSNIIDLFIPNFMFYRASDLYVIISNGFLLITIFPCVCMQVVVMDGPSRVASQPTNQRFHREVMGVDNSGRATSSSHPHQFHHMYSFRDVKEFYGIMEGVVVLEAVPTSCDVGGHGAPPLLEKKL